VVLVALAALAVLITTTRLFLLRDTAITDDEHVYAFMARVFAAGGPGAWVYFHRNPSPDLSDPVLFVKDLGPERNQALMQAMPGRAPFAMGVKDNRLLLVPLRP
jgi:hypothetical protein